MADPSMRSGNRAGLQLAVDWTVCDGRGLCAELLPEVVARDEWGFPLIADPAVPPSLLGHARRAVAACPRLALRLEPSPTPAPSAPGRQRERR